MSLARRSLDDPQRLVELEQQLEAHMGKVLAEVADAGCSSADVLIASSWFASASTRLSPRIPIRPTTRREELS